MPADPGRRRRSLSLLLAATVLAGADGLLPAHADERPTDPQAAQQAADAEYARYQPFSVTWLAVRGIEDARGVYPHPAVADRVMLATGAGLLASADGGKTWQPLEAASAEKVGEVRHVAYRPDSPETFYLATAGRGVWATEDGGASFRRVGSAKLGMASDDVERAIVWPDDHHFRTLYAFHGRAAPGISRSHNGGKSWSVIAAGYYVRRAFPAINSWADLARILVVGSAKDRPELETAFTCSALDGLWSEAFRDIVYTDGAMAFPRTHVYMSTADRGLYRVSEAGATRVGPPEADRFDSVGVTWGPRADKELIYAYEPRRLGLLVSTDGLRSFEAHSRGLYVGPFVKEGAHVRAAANGGRFYAVVNGALYVGYLRTRGVSVTGVSVAPAVVTYHRTAHEKAMAAFCDELRDFRRKASAASAARALLDRYGEVRTTFTSGTLCVTARAFALGGAPQSVTLDLSGLRGAPDEPMFDDGNHGDGAAGDGVYGARLDVDPRYLPGESGRTTPTGRIGLSVKAAAADGSIGGAVGVLSVYSRPEMNVLWADGRNNPLRKEAGEVELPERSGPGDAFTGSLCMELYTGEKPWSASFGDTRRPTNIAGYCALSFWVRTDRGRELGIQLRDAPEFDMPVAGPVVAVVAGKFIEGGALDTEYRRAVVPLGRLLRDTPGFHLTRLGHVIFSGDGNPPARFWIDQVVLHVNPESVAEELQAVRDQPEGARRRR